MSRLVSFALSFAIGFVPALASAYAGGTPGYVADVAPFCASCHSSTSDSQLIGVPEGRVRNELAATKHLAKIEAAKTGSPYEKLSESQRAELIDAIKRIDAVSNVKVLAPLSVKAGAIIEVTVEATGGGGPVVGIGLVDSNQRWQASPAPSRGWQVLEAPTILGQKGDTQTEFTDRRNKALAPGISYVNVYGVSADPANNQFGSVRVTYRLKAPAGAGTYPLGAVFFYGTEKGSPNGSVEVPGRGKQPLGGFTANSGRVKFSDILQIAVQ
ncbi:MAG: DUF5347 domain-containing protein [bacterium]|nr:DUF5347 domain-containing protein [bacterium]